MAFEQIEREISKHPAQRGAGVVVTLETWFDAKGKPHSRFVAVFRTTRREDGQAHATGRTFNSALTNLESELTSKND